VFEAFGSQNIASINAFSISSCTDTIFTKMVKGDRISVQTSYDVLEHDKDKLFLGENQVKAK